MDIGKDLENAFRYGYACGAKQVLDELQSEIAAALVSNYSARTECITKHPELPIDNFVAYCDGKIYALRGIDDFIEELKKKYTEEEQ